jgi:hypothetical protein
MIIDNQICIAIIGGFWAYSILSIKDFYVHGITKTVVIVFVTLAAIFCILMLHGCKVVEHPKERRLQFNCEISPWSSLSRSQQLECEGYLLRKGYRNSGQDN